MSLSCVSRKEIVARTGALKAKFEESARTIIEINGEMPAFREGVVDVRVCTENLTKDITAAVVRLESLDIGTDCRGIAELGPCIDRLREDTDNELGLATSPVTLERLAAELDRVRSMNEQLIAVEQTLHRTVSKRRRLLQELREFGQELEQPTSPTPMRTRVDNLSESFEPRCNRADRIEWFLSVGFASRAVGFTHLFQGRSGVSLVMERE